MNDDVTATVRTLLGAAGIPVTDAEVTEAAVAYPGVRAGVESLHAVPAARYADPALRFRADAVGPETEWWAPHPAE